MRHTAYAVWELTRQQTAWKVGVLRDDQGAPVYAECVRSGLIQLPGDGEQKLGEDEEQLRARFFQLRRRLNLQNAILRAARLLSLRQIEKRKFTKDIHERASGSGFRLKKHTGITTESLSTDDQKKNCQKAADVLLAWADSDALKESLQALSGGSAGLWTYLAGKSSSLIELVKFVPRTEVPSEEEAKSKKVDREKLKQMRKVEEDKFYAEVYNHRQALAEALCSGHDSNRRIAATNGLWAELDRLLIREISYGDRIVRG